VLRRPIEFTIEELKNGCDLDHLVTYRLVPNRVALGFRLLARNLAIGLQLADAATHGLERPGAIREPRTFRATHVEGLGLFTTDPTDHHRLHLTPLVPLPLPARHTTAPPLSWHLPWTGRSVYLAA